jgi:hypothetical protein
MSRELHLHVADRQYEFLRAESAATGLPMAELVRRALDHTYESRVANAARRLAGEHRLVAPSRRGRRRAAGGTSLDAGSASASGFL